MAFENNVSTTLHAAVAIGATSIDVVNAVAPNKDVPAVGRLTLKSDTQIEIITYTGRADNSTHWTLTGVTKNAESSFGDQAWSAGDTCYQALTAADVAGLGGVNMTSAATAPTSPAVGDQWYDTANGVLYVRVTDGTDAAWLDISSANGTAAAAASGGGGGGVVELISSTIVNLKY